MTVSDLKACDFPDSPIIVSYEDGTCLTFMSAFYYIDTKGFDIYTEHSGYFKVPPVDGLRIYGQEGRNK